jgi:hypothetical protein
MVTQTDVWSIIATKENLQLGGLGLAAGDIQKTMHMSVLHPVNLRCSKLSDFLPKMHFE